MANYVIQTKRGAPPGEAYSQGWRAGNFLLVTGTGPIDPLTGELVGSNIEQQTEQTIDNISAVFEADGAYLSASKRILQCKLGFTIVRSRGSDNPKRTRAVSDKCIRLREGGMV